MKKFIVAVLFLFTVFGMTSSADAYVSVKGYYRKNGTYVAPHVRSEPNGVKYDNYGYTPSQGLYNPTYGTRGTSWDTPTYVTDPDYYTGQNIYNSAHSDTGYTPSYTSYTPTPTCPSNSAYDTLSSGCKCNYGYIVSGSSCVNGNSYCYGKYSYNSEYDSTSKTCKCSYGSRWNDESTSCVTNDSYCTSKYGYGAEAKTFSSECVCKTGYTYDGSKCAFKLTNDNVTATYPTIVACVANASPINGKCYCDSGYEINSTKDGCVVKLTCGTGYILKNNTCITNTQDCINNYGQNVYGVAVANNNSTCYCNIGYQWNIGQTSCVEIPTPVVVSTTLVMVTSTVQVDLTPTQLNFTKDLRVGSRGNEVSKLQIILQSKNYLGRLTSSGYFGSLTSVALKKFQKDNGLAVSGYFDQTTRDLFNSL